MSRSRESGAGRPQASGQSREDCAETVLIGTDRVPEHLVASLQASVEEVFTTMLDTVAVLVATRLDQDRLVQTDDGVQATVEFSGSAAGAVVMRCCSAGAAHIARDFLRLSEGDSLANEEIEDALGECANMVSGLLKSHAFAREELILSLPKIAPYSGVASARGGTLIYRLQVGSVVAEVWVDPSGDVEAGSGASL